MNDRYWPVSDYSLAKRIGGVMSDNASICGRSRDEVRKLIAGPNSIHICEGCVVDGSCSVMRADSSETEANANVCDFCGSASKSKEFQVFTRERIICNRCLELSASILAEDYGISVWRRSKYRVLALKLRERKDNIFTAWIQWMKNKVQLDHK